MALAEAFTMELLSRQTVCIMRVGNMPKVILPDATAPPLAPNVTGPSVTDAPAVARRMLSERQVLAIIPVGHTTLWRMAKKGLFPKPTFVSPNRCFWFEDVVLAWQNEIEGRGRASLA
jgi:predicted DNA-binding transcriptional regulator AlpA